MFCIRRASLINQKEQKSNEFCFLIRLFYFYSMSVRHAIEKQNEKENTYE
jgi:hypothetical protein